eukprot:SAG11_NODE_683_length_7747_cov_3.047463_1_plen_316_part_00
MMFATKFLLAAVVTAAHIPTPTRAQTIIDLAVATPSLSTLVAAVTAGDLVETLSGPGPFTVFAPSNEAFARLPPAELARLLAPENQAELVNLLTYHVASGDVRAGDLSNGQQVETLQGQDVGVTILGSRVLIGDGEVTTADVLATNGVVHIIDEVLLPRPDATIVDLAVATPSLSTLVIAVTAAGLVETLSGPGPFTVFAPSNEAFARLPSGTIEFLLDPENIDELIRVLTYHVVSGDVRANDLCNGQQVETLQGGTVNVTILGSRVFIGDGQVTAADVVASNGVVHIIDEVLLPARKLNMLAATAKERRQSLVL